MAYVANEDLKRAREMDLLTYKQSYEPWDLVKLKDGYYQLKSHDELIAKKGKYYQLYTGNLAEN